jgi:hypothetical protein
LVKSWQRHGLKPWIDAAKKRLHHNVLAIALANKLIEDLAADWRRLDERIDELSSEIKAVAAEDSAIEVMPTDRRIGAWIDLDDGTKLNWSAIKARYLGLTGTRTRRPRK